MAKYCAIIGVTLSPAFILSLDGMGSDDSSALAESLVETGNALYSLDCISKSSLTGPSIYRKNMNHRNTIFIGIIVLAQEATSSRLSAMFLLCQAHTPLN